MGCERWRELLSAQLDGEDDPAERGLVDAHLSECAGCRNWLDSAAAVNRQIRMDRPLPVTPDLTDSIMAALVAGSSPAPGVGPVPSLPDKSDKSGFRGWWSHFFPLARVSRVRLTVGFHVALAVVGAVQLISGLAQVGGGASSAHVHTGLAASPGHLWHESAAWNVAVGAGYLFIGLRRSRPSGLVPMLSAFVGMLLLLSVNDLTAGRVDGARLVSHGFVIVGYLLVVALARVNPETVRPPGARRPGGGWRARFEAEEGGRPHLRLVQRPSGPVTARYEEPQPKRHAA